jgi:DNA-binding PadR family transcriptional regulator
MSDVRLFVLGSLLRRGPMHGHQIRRVAQLDRTELWSDVKAGSLYGALHRMAAEGVITALRTEQEGKMPARTVYEITELGRQEFIAARDSVLRTVRLRPDPVDLALAYCDDLSADELRTMIENRRGELETMLRTWTGLHEHAAPYLRGFEPMTFRHALNRIRAEIDWHTELLDGLPKMILNRDSTADPNPADLAATPVDRTPADDA